MSAEKSDFTGFEPREEWVPKPPPQPNGKGNGHGIHDNETPPLECIRLEPVGATAIPPRQWACGRFLLFGSAAVIGAVDGGGKGAVAVAMILAMITGRPLLGEKVWRTGPVAIVTYEDDEEEWHRRIAAACMSHGVDYGQAIANIHFLRRRAGRVVFAQKALIGSGAVFPDGDQIIGHLLRLKAVMLVIDPFNNAHTMDDGNNNVMIAKVAEEISRVARKANVAALVLHHLRKAKDGTVDDLMGATALRANFRSCRILARMTPEEAGKLGVSTDPWRYMRIAGTKGNYAPPPDKATWFKLESVALGNGAGIYEFGDEIGVATIWAPPPVFDGMDRETLRRIFDRLRGQPEPGWFYSTAKAARHRWAGTVIMDVADKTAEQASTILKTWLDNGVLTVEDYTNPQKNKAKRVILNEQKVAEILGPDPGQDA